MYRTFLEDARKVNPNLRVIGLTATPFRMKSGMICAPENVLNKICYEIGVKELIVQGHLSLLITKASREKIDMSGLRIRAGEFVPGDVEGLMDTNELVKAVCGEIFEQTRTRRSVLVFAAGVRHGQHIAEVMSRKCGVEVGTVFGDTLNFERDRVLTSFKAGKLKYLVNVDVLTTGFDAPNIDCVAMVRPTLSPGLYYQMVGRGFRTFEGKENCLVLDFGGNVLRHGPVDAIRIEGGNGGRGGEPPAKECPSCRSLIAAGYSACPDCGHWFPRQTRGMRCHQTATDMGILSGHVKATEHEVQAVYYAVHIRHDKSNTSPRSMRATYRLGLRDYQSEWICFEHTGPVRKRAEAWWRRRSNAPVPESAAEAVELAKSGALCKTMGITVRKDAHKDYDRIVGYVLGDKPPWREPGWDEDGFEQVDPEYACAYQGKPAP
jgi:DNA repair protein RadD